MKDLGRMAVTACFLASLFVPQPALGHGTGEGHKESSSGHDDTAMKAQHERMSRFYETMRALSDTIIHGDVKAAGNAAGLLDRHIKGHEKDIPHKNLARSKEFHGLYVEMEKRTKTLESALKAGSLPKAGVAYGRILEVCASCHGKFRD